MATEKKDKLFAYRGPIDRNYNSCALLQLVNGFRVVKICDIAIARCYLLSLCHNIQRCSEILMDVLVQNFSVIYWHFVWTQIIPAWWIVSCPTSSPSSPVRTPTTHSSGYRWRSKPTVPAGSQLTIQSYLPPLIIQCTI